MGENLKIGRYEIRGTIGRGGMGVVYRAWDPVIGREVALKCLDLKDVSEAQAREIRERFRREAIAAGRLNHPNITMVFDVGEQEGEAFIAMEYIKGESLDKVLSRGESLRLKKVIEVVEGISRALDHAHSMGIVHRDVKPGNILLPESGGVKVTDFGIARIENLRMTQSGAMLGSPSYMSPEQILGKDIDRRSDVFSLGVILYIMITGRKPFPGDSLATLSYRIVQEEPRPPSEFVRGLDPAVDRILSKALAKDPGMRYQQAGELAAAFREAVGDADESPVAPAGERSGKGEFTLPTLTVIPLGLRGKLGPLYRRISPFLAAMLLIVAVALGVWKFAWPELGEFMESTGASVTAEAVAAPEREYKPVGIVPRPYLLWRDARKEIEEGNLENARKMLVELTILAPEDAQAHLQLGKIQKELGATKEALQSYRRALNLDSSMRSDSNLVADLFSLLGTKYGDESSDILADMVGSPAETLLVEAAAAGEAERSRDALETLVKLWRNRLKNNPQDVDARLKVARGLYRLEEYEKALKEYELALEARPEARKDAEIILNAVDLLDTRYHEGAYDLLVKSVGPPALEALKKVSGDGEGSLMQTRAHEAVKGILAGQTEDEENNSEAPLELAYIYEKEGEISSALRYLSKAVERKPSLAGNPRLIELLIKGLGSEKDEQAREILVEHAGDAAIKPLTEALVSEDSDVRWNAARVLIEMGQEDRVNEADLWAKDILDENTSCARKIEAAGKLAENDGEKALDVIERALEQRHVRRCGPGYFSRYLN